MPYFLVLDDEWGIPFTAKTFASTEEVQDEIKTMDEALDDAGLSAAYDIRCIIDQLKEIIEAEKA